MRINSNSRRRLWPAVILAVPVLVSGCGGARIETLFDSDGPLRAESTSEGLYAYEQLNDTEKLIYDEIVYAIENRQENIRLATTGIPQMEKAYQAVRYDHCEYFWLKKFAYVTYTRGDEITAIDLTPEYSMSEETQEKYQKKIDKKAKALMKGLPKDGSDFDKVLYVYQTLIENVDYNTGAKNSQNIISTFVDGETVCQGYAYGTQYLLNMAGISCTTVEGTANDGNHAWNLVKMDGDYYYIDTTWGNSSYTYGDNSGSNGRAEFINYEYFGATTAEIMTTHSASDVIKLPKCTAEKDNYFVHEELYFPGWSRYQTGERIRRAWEEQEPVIQLKFASMDDYEQAYQFLIEDFHVEDYCKGISSVRYIEDVENHILILFLREQEE